MSYTITLFIEQGKNGQIEMVSKITSNSSTVLGGLSATLCSEDEDDVLQDIDGKEMDDIDGVEMNDDLDGIPMEEGCQK